MKQKLAILAVVVAVALGCWKALAGYNPHITYLDLSIDGVADILEYFEPDPNTPSPTPITPNPPKGPGGFIKLNGWQKITLKATGVNAPMKTRLNLCSDKIQIWTALNGGTQVTCPKDYDDDPLTPEPTMPTELWVKGVTVSATGPTKDASGNWTSCGPEHITLEAINNGDLPTTPGTYYDHIAFTVHNKVDLDVDSDYDGDIDDDDDPIEVSAGGWVCLNQDDDNLNGTADKNDSGTVSGENDLGEIQLKVEPTVTSGTVKLEAEAGGSKIKVWESATKGTEVVLPKTWNLSSGSVPASLYVEGVELSDKVRDIKLKLTYKPQYGSFEVSDTIALTVLTIDLDIYRLEGNKVDEDTDHTEGSITRVLNPNDDETAGTGKAKGISLKLEPSVKPEGLGLTTYKLRLKNISTVANDLGLVRVYQNTDCIINNCPPAADSDEDLEESELHDDFWTEFEGGGIMQYELVLFRGSVEACKDTVRACAIGCPPRSGRIIYVKSGGSGGSPYNDYVDKTASSVASALAIAVDNDNIVLSYADYSESALSICKKLSIGGLGLRWGGNEGIEQYEWRSVLYRPKFALLPSVQPATSSRVFDILAGASSVYLGSVVIQSGDSNDSNGGGIRASGVPALGIYASKFHENKTYKAGGAIAYSPTSGESGLLMMTDRAVTYNKAVQGGAGVVVSDSGNVIFNRSEFCVNVTTRADDCEAVGGAFLAWRSEGSWKIEKCLFRANQAYDESETPDDHYITGGYGGAGVFDGGSPKVTVTDTVFRKNVVSSKVNRAAGGAIAFRSNAAALANPNEAVFTRSERRNGYVVRVPE